jgi:hypothetical protein
MASEAKKNQMWKRGTHFALCNAFVFAVFSVLWVKQYHMPSSSSDAIDEIVVPWGWLACFFIASFSTLRGRMRRSALISAASAIVFASALFLFVHIVLAPIYDPWF